MLLLVFASTNVTASMRDLDPQKKFFFTLFKISVYLGFLNSQNAKRHIFSLYIDIYFHLNSYGYLKFGCCIINTRQCVIIRLGNKLRICVVFGKSKPHYSCKLYAYKEKHVASYQYDYRLQSTRYLIYQKADLKFSIQH